MFGSIYYQAKQRKVIQQVACIQYVRALHWWPINGGAGQKISWYIVDLVHWFV